MSSKETEALCKTVEIWGWMAKQDTFRTKQDARMKDTILRKLALVDQVLEDEGYVSK